MIGIMIGCVFAAAGLFIVLTIRDCGNNPAYEAWLIEDQAKYPELYEDETT